MSEGCPAAIDLIVRHSNGLSPPTKSLFRGRIGRSSWFGWLAKRAELWLDCPMHAGILVVGSLLWDPSDEREEWRETRFSLGRCVSVQVPIYYGRRSSSRGNTYTMTFDEGNGWGRAVLIPCAATVDTVEDLVAEAQALWGAEFAAARPGSVGAAWGCVGVAFRGIRTTALAADWGNWFRESETLAVAPVDEAGILRIPWPRGAGRSMINLLLATATAPWVPRPSPEAVADAWGGQADGREDYFFKNVQHGIRTPDDLTIWRRIEQQQPGWLRKREYASVVKLLRREAAATRR